MRAVPWHETTSGMAQRFSIDWKAVAGAGQLGCVPDCHHEPTDGPPQIRLFLFLFLSFFFHLLLVPVLLVLVRVLLLLPLLRVLLLLVFVLLLLFSSSSFVFLLLIFLSSSSASCSSSSSSFLLLSLITTSPYISPRPVPSMGQGYVPNILKHRCLRT